MIIITRSMPGLPKTAQKCQTHDVGRAWCAENCIVVAEGVLQHSGTFKVRALGFPPVELRGESRAAAKVGNFLAPAAGTACIRILTAVGLF